MKNILLKSFVFLFLFVAANQLCAVAQIPAKEPSDRENEELIGAVHTIGVTREILINKPKSDVSFGLLPSLTTLNRDGNVTERLVYNDKGELDTKSVSNYDDAGKKIEEILSDRNNSLRARIVHVYNDEGVLIELEWYDRDNKLTNTHKVSHERTPDGAGATHASLVTAFTVVTKNADGKPAEENFFTKDEKLVLRAVYEYTPEGVTTKNFDPFGVLISTYKDNYAEKKSRILTNYDSQNGTSDKFMFSYELDSQGNWIIEKMLQWTEKNGTSTLIGKKITRRTITYY
jgi:hypothetical protein